jgi:hypothetical protein
MMNESFRRFVLRSTYRVEIQRWEHEERASLWRALRLSGAIAGVLLAAWIVWAFPNMPTMIVTSVTLMTALIGGLGKIIDLRSDAIVATTLPKIG